MFKISDISNDLVSKYNLSKKEADAFVASMFNVIIDGLQESGSQVKVKGLGTFKLTPVSSRESVNVNTGERIVIDGRDKMSFTPDTSLKDRVNSPFAQFETVVLNDGVDFSEVETEEAAQEPPVEVSEEPVAPAEEPVIPAESIPADSTEELAAPAESSRSAVEEESVGPAESSQSAAEEESVGPAENLQSAADEAPQAPEETPLPVVEEPITTVKDNVAEMTETEEIPQEDENNNEQNTDSTQNDMEKRSMKTILVALLSSAAVLLVVACVGCYLLFSQLAKRDERIEQLEMRIASYAQSVQTQPQVVQPQPQAVQTKPQTPSAQTQIPAVKSENQKAEKAETAKEGNAQPEQAKAQETPVAPSKDAKPAMPDQSKYNSDPRVRTGAYAIMGIDKEVTVKSGQTLSSISRAHLGPDMECYVEAVNANKPLKVGDKVKIPKLMLKKRLKH